MATIWLVITKSHFVLQLCGHRDSEPLLISSLFSKATCDISASIMSAGKIFLESICCLQALEMTVKMHHGAISGTLPASSPALGGPIAILRQITSWHRSQTLQGLLFLLREANLLMTKASMVGPALFGSNPTLPFDSVCSGHSTGAGSSLLHPYTHPVWVPPGPLPMFLSPLSIV